MSEKLRLQREQLHRFIGDDEDAVRVFEKLFRGYNDLLTGVAGDFTVPGILTVAGEATQGLGIIESGSNTNGNYVVFSSGLQVCWGSWSRTTNTSANNLWGTASGTTYYRNDSGSVFGFPNAYAISPYVVAKAQGASVVNHVVLRDISATAFGAVTSSGSANSITVDWDWIAIGEAG